MGKKLVSTLVMIVLVLSLGVTGASARWNINEDCTASFNIDGTTAECSLNVYAENSSDRITATIQIIRINDDGSRTPIKAWNGLAKTGSLIFNQRFKDSQFAPSAIYRMYYSVNIVGVDSISEYIECEK